jgi:hypothetical protein
LPAPTVSSESGLLWTRRKTFWILVGDFLVLAAPPAPFAPLVATTCLAFPRTEPLKLGFCTLLHPKIKKKKEKNSG